MSDIPIGGPGVPLAQGHLDAHGRLVTSVGSLDGRVTVLEAGDGGGGSPDLAATAARVYGTENQGLPANATTPLTYGAADPGWRGSGFVDLVTGRYTCPARGMYAMGGTFAIHNTSLEAEQESDQLPALAPVRLLLLLTKNGAPYLRSVDISFEQLYASLNGSGAVLAVSGDQLWWALQTDGPGVVSLGGESYKTMTVLQINEG